jgi:hypothetical protein
MAAESSAIAGTQRTISGKASDRTLLIANLERRPSASSHDDGGDENQDGVNRNRKHMSALWCSTLSLSWSISGLLTIVVVWIGCMHWTQLMQLRAMVDRLDADLKQTEQRCLHHINLVHDQVRWSFNQ